MNKKHIALVGANGRMGKEIYPLLIASSKLKPTAAVIRTGTISGFDKYVTDIGELKSQDVDAIIDFSGVESFDHILKSAVHLKRPLVSGVTGISDTQKVLLKKASQTIPILWSANMSLGVATLKKAIHALKGLDGFDFQIEELHHNKKKDNPSGTALMLQNELIEVVNKKVPEPVGIRGGGIFGVHKIYAMADEELLVFEHTALNRSVFAKGAVKATEWILEQPPGLYSMDDVLRG